VSVTNVSDAIPDDPDAAFWKAIAPNHIALVGQVIVDPRNFNPSIDLVSVRAVYHDKEIAFHLTWDDPTQSVEDAAKKTYADAISLQFPPQPRPGPERPYFLMGDASDGVYLLRWQNGKGVTEAAANGPTKIAPLAGSETDWFDELLDITRAPAVPTDRAAATATNAAIRPSRLGPPWRAAARPSCGRGEATEALAAAGAADLALACGPVVERAARISAMFSGMVRSRGPSVAALSSSARRYAEAWPGRGPGPASVGSEV